MYQLQTLLEAASNQNCVNNSICTPTCTPLGSIALSIISSLGSVVGSLLIIVTFLRWQDLRTVARMILVFLAIADLFTGVGYIFGAAIYLKYQFPSPYCKDYVTVNHSNLSTTYINLCIAQSFFTTLMPIVSFFWTANLSIYLFFAVGLQKIDFAKKLMIPFHITAWGIPFITGVVLLVNHNLGPSGLQSSGAWCWIKDDEASSDSLEAKRTAYKKYFIVEFTAGKMWEIAVCILSLTLCLAIKVLVWRRYKTAKAISLASEDSSINRRLRHTFTRVDQKLIWIPVAFLLIRMWGNIRFFISVPPLYFCPSEHYCNLLYHPALVYLQSIGDPGQGWSNALLFVVFNHKILKRLCPYLYLCGQRCRGACNLRCSQRRISRNPKHVRVAERNKKVMKQDVFIGKSYRSEHNPLTSDASSVLYYAIPKSRTQKIHLPDLDTSS